MELAYNGPTGRPLPKEEGDYSRPQLGGPIVLASSVHFSQLPLYCNRLEKRRKRTVSPAARCCAFYSIFNTFNIGLGRALFFLPLQLEQ